MMSSLVIKELDEKYPYIEGDTTYRVIYEYSKVA